LSLKEYVAQKQDKKKSYEEVTGVIEITVQSPPTQQKRAWGRRHKTGLKMQKTFKRAPSPLCLTSHILGLLPQKNETLIL